MLCNQGPINIEGGQSAWTFPGSTSFEAISDFSRGFAALFVHPPSSREERCRAPTSLPRVNKCRAAPVAPLTKRRIMLNAIRYDRYARCESRRYLYLHSAGRHFLSPAIFDLPKLSLRAEDVEQLMAMLTCYRNIDGPLLPRHRYHPPKRLTRFKSIDNSLSIPRHIGIRYRCEVCKKKKR